MKSFLILTILLKNRDSQVFTPGLYTWGSDLNILASCTCAGGANDSEPMFNASALKMIS